MTKIYRILATLSNVLVFIGGFIILIQSLWITYGVIMRYIFNSPDGVVTEATALLLVPVAFLGLAYALKEDAYPKVSLITDLLSIKFRLIINKINLIIMTVTGGFFTTAIYRATIKSYVSGASSEILLWKRFYFWIPVFISLLIFTLLAIVLLVKKTKD